MNWIGEIVSFRCFWLYGLLLSFFVKLTPISWNKDKFELNNHPSGSDWLVYLFISSDVKMTTKPEEVTLTIVGWYTISSSILNISI